MNLSGVVAPLTTLKVKGVDTVGQSKTREAIVYFEKLKKIFLNKAFLIQFDFALPRVINMITQV